VTNRGDRLAAPLDLTGELLAQRREARLALGVPPGGEGAVHLDFDPTEARPGLHALTLLLEHPVEGPADGAFNPPMASQRAWLLIALGANPGPAVRLAADTLHLDVKGDLAVRLESADGEGHRVRLRALTARGLRAEGGGAEVAVSGKGTSTAALPLVRTGAPRGSRHAVLLVAEVLDGPIARTAVVVVPVEIAVDPSLLPRLRPPLLALGLVLLLVAIGFEAQRLLGRTWGGRKAMTGPLVGDATKLRIFAASVDNLLAMFFALFTASRLPELPDTDRLSVAVVVYLAYFAIQEGAWSNTVGKRLFGLCIRRLNGSACGWNAALIRTLARILEANPILLGGLPAALAGAFSRRHQRFGDMLSGCVVIRRTSCGPEDRGVEQGDEGADKA
jgi:uncharacterized RDD family membrane protein YckC